MPMTEYAIRTTHAVSCFGAIDIVTAVLLGLFIVFCVYKITFGR